MRDPVQLRRDISKVVEYVKSQFNNIPLGSYLSVPGTNWRVYKNGLSTSKEGFTVFFVFNKTNSWAIEGKVRGNDGGHFEFKIIDDKFETEWEPYLERGQNALTLAEQERELVRRKKEISFENWRGGGRRKSRRVKKQRASRRAKKQTRRSKA
jgi:hypothetical protein